MDNLPSNSHVSRKPVEEAPKKEKKFEKVVTGEVTRAKKPLGRRFLETFTGDDTKSVIQYVIMEVALPAVRDMIADIVSQGIERKLYGEVRSVGRRSGTRPSGANGYVGYNQISRGRSPHPTMRPEPREERRQVGYDFENIVLATRAEGEEVIRRMFLILEEYQTLSIYDLYELVGITGNSVDYKWGWTDIRGVGIMRINNGYLLDLPKPTPLD